MRRREVSLSFSAHFRYSWRRSLPALRYLPPIDNYVVVIIVPHWTGKAGCPNVCVYIDWFQQPTPPIVSSFFLCSTSQYIKLRREVRRGLVRLSIPIGVGCGVDVHFPAHDVECFQVV
jgi:hypothetical protein